MEYAWKQTCEKHNLKIKFKRYFSYVGFPFFEILKKLKINKKKFATLKKTYEESSIRKFYLIKKYTGVNKTISILNKKKNFETAIITSKSQKRSNLIIKKLNIKIKNIFTPNGNIKGKPNIDIFNKLVKKMKLKKNDKYTYIGDANVDLMFSKRINAKFIFAQYGYGKIKEKNILKIKSIEKILDINFLT